jgi:hypothetical protein
VLRVALLVMTDPQSWHVQCLSYDMKLALLLSHLLTQIGKDEIREMRGYARPPDAGNCFVVDALLVM